MKRLVLVALLLASLGSIAWGVSSVLSPSHCPLEGTQECPLPPCCK